MPLESRKGSGQDIRSHCSSPHEVDSRISKQGIVRPDGWVLYE